MVNGLFVEATAMGGRILATTMALNDNENIPTTVTDSDQEDAAIGVDEDDGNKDLPRTILAEVKKLDKTPAEEKREAQLKKNRENKQKSRKRKKEQEQKAKEEAQRAKEEAQRAKEKELAMESSRDKELPAVSYCYIPATKVARLNGDEPNQTLPEAMDGSHGWIPDISQLQ